MNLDICSFLFHYPANRNWKIHPQLWTLMLLMGHLKNENHFLSLLKFVLMTATLICIIWSCKYFFLFSNSSFTFFFWKGGASFLHVLKFSYSMSDFMSKWTCPFTIMIFGYDFRKPLEGTLIYMNYIMCTSTQSSGSILSTLLILMYFQTQGGYPASWSWPGNNFDF